jgi:biopolymer transport protein ExbD
VVNSSIAVDLPRESAQASEPQPQNIIVTVDAQGAIYWFDTPVPDAAAFLAQLTAAAQQQPQPELHIRADARADYDAVGRVVYAAQQAGIERVGFLTEPPQ